MLDYCFIPVPPIICRGEVLFLSLFWYALLYVLSSLKISLTRKGELVALLSLSFGWMSCYSKCFVAIPHGAVDRSAVWHCIAVFCDQTHLLFVFIM